MSGETLAWYRQGWPWLLMAIPASAVLMGFLMLWLALNTRHAMVVDDYYKHGKAINKRIERDVNAAQIGMTASLVVSDSSMRIRLSALSEQIRFPPSLVLRAVHPSDDRKDRRYVLTQQPAGHYQTSAGLTPGRWALHIEPPDAHWRLVQATTLVRLNDAVRIVYRSELLQTD